MGEIIKFLIYAISMCAIELVINSLYNRKSITDNAGRNEFHYVLKIPGALKYTCMAFFILGLCMFCIFFVFKLQNNPTVTNGHLWMCSGGNGNWSSWHNPGKQMEDRGKRKSDGDTTFISEKYSFTDK